LHFAKVKYRHFNDNFHDFGLFTYIFVVLVARTYLHFRYTRIVSPSIRYAASIPHVRARSMLAQSAGQTGGYIAFGEAFTQ